MLDLAKVIEKVEEEQRKSKQQHEEALKNLTLSRLDFERQLGHISESQYEQQLRDQMIATRDAELKQLEDKKRIYQQDPVEFAKVEADIVKLNDKYNADIEKANQKSLLRRQEFGQYFKQISGSFNTALNGWMQGTETASQAFGKMFQDILSQLISFVEQWVEKKIEMWLMDRIIADSGNQGEVETKIASNVAQIESDAFVAAAEAYSFWAWDPITAMEAAAEAYSAVSSMAIGAGGVGAFELGGIVPQTGLALVHKGETILPASMSGKGFDGGIGGGAAVHVHMNVNAIDSSSFKDTVGKHGHMIGELVTKALKKKGIK